MPLILCRLCGELVNSNSERCKCGGSTRQTSTLATSPSDGNVDRWQKKYASPLSAPPSLPKPSTTSSATVQELPPISLHPPPSPSLCKTYGSLLSLSSPLSCVSCSRPFPPDATLYPAKAPSSNPNYFSPPEEETYKCRSCYTKEDSLGGCEKCGKAVLGVKEIGGSGRGEGKFVRSGKRLWCQGCFACDGCSTLLRPTPAHPPLLHPITSKPICEDCLFNPPQSPSGPSSARRPLPQRTTLSSSSSNIGGFGPSRSTSSMSGETTSSNAAVEELRTRLGIASIGPSASRTSVSSRVESSPLPSSSSATRPMGPPASSSYGAPRLPTFTSTSRTYAPSQLPIPSPPPSISSAPDDTCPGCTGLLAAPPLSSTPAPRRSPYDRIPPPVTSIALITLPAQLGGQTFHAVCFRCDGCGDALVSPEGEDAQVGVGVSERGKGVCMKCVKPSRFSVPSSTRPISSTTSSAAIAPPRPRYQSNPTPPAPSPPPANPLRSSYSRGGNASPSGPAPPATSASAGGTVPNKLGGSILERAGVKKRVD